MLKYPKNYPIEGKIYPRLFLNGTYESRNVKPIRRIFGIGWQKQLTWTCKPSRDKYGTLYKETYLNSIKHRYNVIVKYYDDDASEADSFRYKGTLNSNVPFEERRVTRMVNVYSKRDGGYVGLPEDVWMYEQRGIDNIQKANEDHKVCSIGYNIKERKWYGWSHRAMFGFTIGSKVKMGNCGFMPSNVTEMIDDLKRWYDDDGHVNLKLTPQEDGVRIQYDSIPTSGPNKGKHTLSQDSVEPYPIWGRGEWEAKTMDDAKQMAIDFADGVS